MKVNTDAILLVLALLTLLFGAMSIPISSTEKDLKVDLTIEKPLLGDVKIVDINIKEMPHTLITPPSFLASILTSDPVSVRLSSATTSSYSQVGDIYRGTARTVTVYLPKVPLSQSPTPDRCGHVP